MSTTEAQIKRAIGYWMHVVGDGALQPNEMFCTLAANGTVWLKNVNGHLGFVTRTGKCSSCVGGERLDETTTSGRA